MVGVPGRSKGCRTCRRRRIKCDQGRPYCTKCRKSGRPCEGYPETSFIHVSFENSGASSNPSSSSLTNVPETSSGNASASSQPAAATFSAIHLPGEAHPVHYSSTTSLECSASQSPATDPHISCLDLLPTHTAWTAPPPTAPTFSPSTLTFPPSPLQPTIPPTLSLIAFQDAIFITYTRTNLLRGIDAYPTLFRAPLAPSTHPLASTSLLALSTTYFALTHPSATTTDRTLHRIRRARYATALAAVNAALSAPFITTTTTTTTKTTAPTPTVDTLTAVTALALHEFLSPTSETSGNGGWIAHCLGLARLFELCGARAVAASPDLRALFETARPVMILAALAARRRSAFAAEAWRRVPWEGLGVGVAGDEGAKDRIHLLMDFLAVGSGLLAGREELLGGRGDRNRDRDRDGGGDGERTRASLVDEAWGLLRGTEAWKAEWDRVFPGCRTEVTAGASASACQGVTPLWTTVWEYGNLYLANSVALYHATRIFLLAFLMSLTDQETEGSEQDLPAALACEMYESAVDVCRSVDYHLLDFQDGAGSFFILFPLRMAWQAFGSGVSPEARWVEQVMEGISSRSRGRWSVAGHLVGRDSDGPG